MARVYGVVPTEGARYVDRLREQMSLFIQRIRSNVARIAAAFGGQIFLEYKTKENVKPGADGLLDYNDGTADSL